MTLLLTYKIKKVFNTNVILAVREKEDQELVRVGKGLGLSTEPGEIVNLKEKMLN